MRKNKLYISRHTVKYIIISYINVGFNILINLFLINKLSSYDFGRVSIGKIIFQSFDLSHLGIRNGFDRLFPRMENNDVTNEYFTVGLLCTFISSIGFLIFWAIYKSNSILFYFFFALAGILSSLVMLYRIYYRSLNDKKKFVSLSGIFILLPPSAEILGFLIGGITGYLIGFLSSYIVIFIIAIKKYSVKLSLIKKNIFIILKNIFNKGTLVYLSGLISFFATSLDRLFIEQYWGLEAVGVFSVIMFVFSIFGVFAVNYTEMIMNKIISLRSIKYVLKQISYILLLIIALVTIVYFFFPFLINLFMKQYVAIIPLMRIIIFAAIPYSVLAILNYYMHAIDQRKILLLINIFCTLSYFIGLYCILNQTTSFQFIMYLKIAFYTLLSLLTFIAATIFSKRIN